MATGCGGGKRATTSTIPTRTATPTTAAVCLNGDAFLVEASGKQIRGSSPGGVNFTATFYRSPAAAAEARARLNPRYSATIAATVVDYSGNPPARPGAAPMVLIRNDFATLRHCIELRKR